MVEVASADTSLKWGRENGGQIPIQESIHIGDDGAATKLGSDPHFPDPISEHPSAAHIAHLLDQIPDPEIPVVSIRELGILRGVSVSDHGAIEITITPTYSGCPAIDSIEADIRAALQAAGHVNVKITTQLAPAWTTDWMGAEAKDKLRAYGIAPPQHLVGVAEQGFNVIQFAPKNRAIKRLNTLALGSFYSKAVPCPRCTSPNTTETSHFASTACKALYKCLNCLEPFDYFKPY